MLLRIVRFNSSRKYLGKLCILVMYFRNIANILIYVTEIKVSSYTNEWYECLNNEQNMSHNHSD